MICIVRVLRIFLIIVQEYFSSVINSLLIFKFLQENRLARESSNILFFDCSELSKKSNIFLRGVFILYRMNL